MFPSNFFYTDFPKIIIIGKREESSLPIFGLVLITTVFTVKSYAINHANDENVTFCFYEPGF